MAFTDNVHLLKYKKLDILWYINIYIDVYSMSVSLLFYMYFPIVIFNMVCACACVAPPMIVGAWSMAVML